MFSKAYDIARSFVIPIVVSSRAGNGNCASAIGTAIVVNQDGWILTSAHILQLIEQQRESIVTWRAYRRQVRELEKDTASATPHRKKKLHHMDRPRPESTQNNSVWWGKDGVRDLRCANGHVGRSGNRAPRALRPGLRPELPGIQDAGARLPGPGGACVGWDLRFTKLFPFSTRRTTPSFFLPVRFRCRSFPSTGSSPVCCAPRRRWEQGIPSGYSSRLRRQASGARAAGRSSMRTGPSGHCNRTLGSTPSDLRLGRRERHPGRLNTNF